MASSHHEWLLTQLPEWQREGLLTESAATALRERAQKEAAQQGGQVGLIIFGGLGVALVASGIIALLAHNWDMFPRWVRLVIGFAPMLVGQLATAWVLRCGEAWAAWVREAVGLFLAISVGTCLAIVSQVYNMGGRVEDFLLAWCLLAVPVLWLLRTSSVASLYLIGITIWADGGGWWSSGSRWLEIRWFPLLLLPFLPWWPGLKWRTCGAPPLGFRWVAAIFPMFASVEIFAAMPLCPWRIEMHLAQLLAALFVLLPEPGEGFGRRPFLVVGGLCLVGTGIFLSFESRSWSYYGDASELVSALSLPVVWVYLALLIWASVRAVLAQHWACLALAAISLVPFASPGVAWPLATVILIATGVLMVLPAFRDRGGWPRLGALLLAFVIVTRFLDSDLPLVGKGVGFIAVGMGFIVFNILLARRVRSA